MPSAVGACTDVLPLGPRPVVQISATARILIASQAPGTKVHESGIPFSDASGDSLREWMGVSADQFYDESKIAILPMGLCYPGRQPSGGDAPPPRMGAALARSPAGATPLPHPSWRSRHWAAKNPWFEADVLPALRSAVQDALA